jgi:hypothetical protein
MPTLRSRTITIADSVITTKDLYRTKSLMPLTGDMYIWYGEYTDTAAQLKLVGMLIPKGALMEHIDIYTGYISLVSASGSNELHEVI